MYKKTITFKDLDGQDVVQDFYFAYNETEISVMEASQKGGLISFANKISNEKDGEKVMKLFEELILGAYGEKAADNIHFIKFDPVDHHRLADDFKQTDAYNKLFMEIANKEGAAEEFFEGIIPEGAKQQVNELREKEELPGQKNYNGPTVITNIADKMNKQ